MLKLGSELPGRGARTYQAGDDADIERSFRIISDGRSRGLGLVIGILQS